MQDPKGSQGKGLWGISGLSLLTIKSTHFNNRISVSANEIVYKWKMKRFYLLASWGILSRIVIGSYPGCPWDPIRILICTPGTWHPEIVYIYIYTYKYTHTYIYIYIHTTCIYIYIYMYTFVLRYCLWIDYQTIILEIMATLLFVNRLPDNNSRNNGNSRTVG